MRKGEISKQELMVSFFSIFTEYGIRITINQMAKKIGVSVGKITYHFPTKDDIFLEFSNLYMVEAQQLFDELDAGKQTLLDILRMFSTILDLQIKYRPLFTFIPMISAHDTPLYKQFRERNSNSKKIIRKRITGLQEKGYLKPELNNEEFEVFYYQVTTMFSSWVLDANLFSKGDALKKLKRKYLLGLINIYIPYLTDKGRKDFLAYRKEIG